MNRENILAVANAIETHSIPDLGFNMGWHIGSLADDPNNTAMVDRSGNGCGTVACIAGYANVIATGEKNTSFLTDVEFDSAADWLGLDHYDADELFYAKTITESRWEDGEIALAPRSLSSIDATEAVAVLRHLADTGIVDWSVAASPPVDGETGK